ncbi:hypothetical protein L1887_12986 [Cichorium endivia]|nr:hypothetical protein L1887_12986 [Cichorium endivia]
MKPSLSCVLLRFLIITTCSIYSTTTTLSEILDITGRELVRNGGKYYIIPIQGGRIKLTATMDGEKFCPLKVVRDPSEDTLGDGFYFTHYTRDAFLRTSRILSIDSGSLVGECKASTIWAIPNAESKAPSNLITSGGDRRKCFQVVNYPRPIGSDSKFRPPTYMLQYCPSFCGATSKTCFNISIYSYKGVTRLASGGGTPFEFGFYKVQTTGDSM